MINFKREILTLLALLFAGALFFSACQNTTNNSFEDTVEPYMELQAINEASNTTITLNRGDAKGLDSYFSFDISNVNENKFVREGLTEGWCLEWDKPISQNNDVHRGIEMYSTYGSKTWKPANYLMNIKRELKDNDPSLTYKEIQVALWSLIETPEFNLDKVLANNQMPARMMKNGQPDFSVSKVKGIVDKVRSESADFNYGFGSDYFVFAKTGHDDQNGGHTTTKCGETAWAFGEPYGQDWSTYTEYEAGKTVPLYAGQHYHIGDVTFSASNGGMVTITIEMNTTGGYQNVSENVKIQGYSDIPPNSPGGLGSFDHKVTVAQGTTTFSTDVPKNNYYGIHVDALSSESCEEIDD